MSELAKTDKNEKGVEVSEKKISIETLKSLVAVTPLKQGGTNFRTHVLIKVSPTMLSYKPSYSTAIFCWIFFAVGLGLLFFGIRSYFLNSQSLQFQVLLLCGIGFIFTLAGSLMFYFFYQPIVFDTSKGLFKKGYTRTKTSGSRPKANSVIELDKVVALQIIGEYVRTDKSSYNSFELNLVLNNAERVNIIDHGNLKALLNEAEMLSTFIDIPIWHAKSQAD